MKTFMIQYNIGHCKYVVSFHDGVKKHADGSPFFDACLFSNKRKMEAFVRTLKDDGYKAL